MSIATTQEKMSMLSFGRKGFTLPSNLTDLFSLRHLVGLYFGGKPPASGVVDGFLEIVPMVDGFIELSSSGGFIEVGPGG
jgi:hypothetical protein